MIGNGSRAGVAVIFLLTLYGCGSTPKSNHYLLTAYMSSPPTGQGPALGIGPIEIPEYLNRNTLVYRAGGNLLHIPGNERWAEPLSDGIARVLSLNLAALLNTENVQSYPWHPKRSPDYGVKVRVLVLDADARNALLIAEWLLYRPDTSEPVSRRMTRLEEPLDTTASSPEALPPAYSSLVYRLSEILAEAIESAERERSARDIHFE